MRMCLIMICKIILLSGTMLLFCLTMSSCTGLDLKPVNNKTIYPFSGEWQGKGVDSEGNSFNFYSKVIHLGENRYQMLILSGLDKLDEPLHVMEGVLENNKFSYTSDKGSYKGEGTLSKDRFEGYYKGPVDGTYSMRRLESEVEHK